MPSANAERRYADERLSVLVLRDQLLSIPNMISMEWELEQNPNYDAVVVLDVEELRKISDAYGRACGDALLLALRDRILDLADVPADSLYCLYSASFVLLLRGEPESPLKIAQALHNCCRQPFRVSVGDHDHELYITVRVGVIPLNHVPMPHLHGVIQYTLDIARRTTAPAVYDEAAKEDYEHGLRLEARLQHAVRAGMRGFSLAYQPIVDHETARWRGVEALCRWSDRELGEVPPDQFIPVAESAGLISPLGLWVLEEAVRTVKQWGLDQREGFILDVNISPVQLANPELDQLVLDILRRHSYPPHKLCLEVTESSELEFCTHTLRTLDRLGELGVLIALDDFGSGYASLHSLHKLPVRAVKIDRSLVAGMELDGFLQRMFTMTAELAHGSNKQVVAEGVETPEQARLLAQQGADYFQGYLYSPPLTAAQFEACLSRFERDSSETKGDAHPARLSPETLALHRGGDGLDAEHSRLLVDCMHTLLCAQGGAIDEVLAAAGRALGVNRAYLVRHTENGALSVAHEWHRPGLVPYAKWMEQLPEHCLQPAWIEWLRQNAVVRIDDSHTVSGLLQEFLDHLGIRSLVEFPIWEADRLQGLIGFCDCDDAHDWTEAQLRMLHTLCDGIASSQRRELAEKRSADEALRMKSMLNNLDSQVYVTDIETNRILFVSRRLQQQYGGKELVGKICWEALQNRRDRCEHCPVPRVMARPEQQVSWEHYNTVLGSHMRMRDTVILWPDNRLVHVQYAENITELKQHQLRLESFATTDALTSTLNRRSMISSTLQMLARAAADGTTVTLAFVDIDGLKRENDSKGHAAGDALICDVVGALRANIRAADLIGRFGGDEFVIAFAGCRKESARARIEIALQALYDRRRGAAGFSYGLVENSEVEYTPEPLYIDKLLNIADIRMLENKRLRRSFANSSQTQYLS